MVISEARETRGSNMTFVAVTAFLVGAILAQRFRVFVLVPVLGLTTFIAFGVVMMVEADRCQAAVGAIVAIIGVQVGYLGGAPFRVCAVVAHGRIPRSTAIEKTKSMLVPL
jgi:hypothetical protein